MKMFFLLMVLSLVLLSTIQTADETENLSKKELVKLIHKLSSARNLKKSLNISRGDKASESRRKSADEKIKYAKLAIPKIRKALKKGSSIFEYPGLIAKGTLHYDIESKRYSLYLGIFVGEQGIGNSDFEIKFDEKGIIKSIESLNWKH